MLALLCKQIIFVMLKNTLFVFLFLTGILSFAQSVIYGTITDEAGMPISGADVFIDGTDYYYMTMDDGTYELEVEPGEYTVTYSVFGFDEKQVNVIITTNESIEHDVVLNAQTTGTVGLDAIVVTADSNNPENEAAALQEQRKADVIIETISGGEISRKGISDAGEAVKSIVGITKEEGSSNVYVRGLSDRYQNTTFNGLPIPSNSSDKKNIDLDIFNSDVIEGVAVSKTYSPHFNGDFGAGNVDIKSKSHYGRANYQIGLKAGYNTSVGDVDGDFKRSEGSGYWGYYGRYDHNPFSVIVQHGMDPDKAGSPINIAGSASLGQRIRFENQSELSVLLSGSFGNDYSFRQGIDGAYGDTKDVYFDDAQKFNYSTSTTGLADFTYTVNNANKFKFVSLFINNSSDEVGYFGTTGTGYDPDLATEGGLFAYNSQFQQTRLFVNQLMGENELMDNFTLNWGVGYNNVLSNTPDRKRILLLNYGTPEIEFNRDLRDFGSQRFFEDINDEEVASRFEFKYTFGEDDDANRSALKFGYNGKYKLRDFESITYGIADVNEDYAIDVYNFDSIFNFDNWAAYFDNSLDNVFSYAAIRPILTSDDLGGVYDPRYNFPGRPDAIYDGKLITHAPYAAIEFRPNDKWLIIPGVRYENYNQHIAWDVNNSNPPEDETGFDQWEFLPSLNIKYSPTQDINLRLAGSRTVSIPEFKEIAPFENIGVTRSIAGNPTIINPDAIEQGSTGKTISDIYNYDLKFEWFPNRGELISVALFGKQINAPVNLVLAAGAANLLKYFRTGEKANVYGVEVELEKNLLKMETGDLSFGGNFSYTHTKQDLFPAIVAGSNSTFFDIAESELQGASPFIANADISYNGDYGNYETTFTLSGNYFSDRIFALGSVGRGNQIEKGVPTLNLVWINRIGKHLEVNASAKNILNPDVEIVQENTQDGTVPVLRYKKGTVLGLSLKYNF